MTESKPRGIADPCPACGSRSLFIAEGGWLTCASLRCSEPGVSRAVDDLKARLAAMQRLANRARVLTQAHLQAVACDLDTAAVRVLIGELDEDLRVLDRAQGER
jgi:hypothetical protein